MTAIDMPETTAMWGERDDTIVRGRLPYSWVDEPLTASRQARQLALITHGYYMVSDGSRTRPSM